MFPLTAVLLLCSAAPAQQLVKMNSEHRGLPIVRCVIAGKPMNCLIDSGSDITFVPPSDQLKTSARKFTIKTSTGMSQLPETEVTVQIGTANVTLVALVQKLAKIMPFDAILGENFLRAFKQVSFDYDHSAVLLGATRQGTAALHPAIIP
jgi:hypothetical protein